jgi:hypothetical protein
VTTPRRLTRLLRTHPEHLWTKDTDLLGILTAACPEMTALARLTGEFAALLTPAQANDNKLTTTSSPTGSPMSAPPTCPTCTASATA